MIDTDRLDELLTRLRLTAIRDQLDSLLDEASLLEHEADQVFHQSGDLVFGQE